MVIVLSSGAGRLIAGTMNSALYPNKWKKHLKTAFCIYMQKKEGKCFLTTLCIIRISKRFVSNNWVHTFTNTGTNIYFSSAATHTKTHNHTSLYTYVQSLTKVWGSCFLHGNSTVHNRVARVVSNRITVRQCVVSRWPCSLALETAGTHRDHEPFQTGPQHPDEMGSLWMHEKMVLMLYCWH